MLRSILLLCVCRSILAFYLPEKLVMAPTMFCKRDANVTTYPDNECKYEVQILANRLNSLQSLIPFEYHKFDFCSIDKLEKMHAPSENLGQVLFGDRIQSSPYKFNFGDDVICREVCTKRYNSTNFSGNAKLKFLKDGIVKDYNHHWIVDNVPVSWCYDIEGGRTYCARGLPIGCLVDKNQKRLGACAIDGRFMRESTLYLFNHLEIEIIYHSSVGTEWVATLRGNGNRLISAKVVPRSIKHGDRPDCSIAEPMSIPLQQEESRDGKNLEIMYTYSVKFTEDNRVKWSSRWDHLLDSSRGSEVQWLSIFNSLVAALFLLGILAAVLKRIARYDRISKSLDQTTIKTSLEQQGRRFRELAPSTYCFVPKSFC